MAEKTLAQFFEEDLLSLFGERIKSDLEFCYRLYGSLGNVDWFKEEYEDNNFVAATLRQWAACIAEWRDKDEHYTDFYCSAPEGCVDKEIAEKMAEKGWKFKEFSTMAW